MPGKLCKIAPHRGALILAGGRPNHYIELHDSLTCVESPFMVRVSYYTQAAHFVNSLLENQAINSSISVGEVVVDGSAMSGAAQQMINSNEGILRNNKLTPGGTIGY